MQLQHELEIFQRELPRLLEAGEEGRHVLILGDEVVGLWDTRRDAVQAGHQRFGVVPFLVKQVCKEDRPIVITRFLTPNAHHH